MRHFLVIFKHCVVCFAKEILRKYRKFQRRNGNWFPTNSARSTKRAPGSCPWEKPGQTGKACTIAQSRNDQQKIFQVQCGLGRIEDQLPPPCSPARRPRSASICRYYNFIFQRILLHIGGLSSISVFHSFSSSASCFFLTVFSVLYWTFPEVDEELESARALNLGGRRRGRRAA